MKEIAWEEIYRQQSPKLLGLCRRYVRDTSRAEDLMHDAFLTAIRKQESFAGTGALEGWLRQIALNTVLMHLRQEKKLTQLLQNDIPDSQEEVSDDSIETPKAIILAADFDRADFASAIEMLPEHHQLVFNLYVFEDYSHKQIADSLGISIGTSKSHLARARKKIQHILLQKAQKMEKRRKRAAILPFLPDEPTAYIDDLCRRNIGNIPTEPTMLPEHLKMAFQQAKPVKVTAVAAVSTPALLAGGATLLSLAGLMFFLLSNRPVNINTSELPANTSMEAMPAVLSPDTVATLASTPPLDLPKKQLEKPVVHQKAIDKQPVVVRKKVVVKDTLFQIEH